MATDQAQPVQSNQSVQSQVVDVLTQAAEERQATQQPVQEVAQPEAVEEAEVIESVEEIPVEETGEAEPQGIEAAVLAQMFGVNEADLVIEDGQPVSIRTKIDGQEGEVNIEDLRRSYQLRKHTDANAAKLNSERETWQQQKEQQQEYLTHSLGQVQGVLKREENALLDEVNKIDWQTLEKNDPAQWSVLRQKYSERYNGIQAATKQAEGEYQTNLAQRQHEIEGKKAQYKQEQYDLLLESLPQWKDTAIAQKESLAIADYAQSMGYSANEVDQILDHRAINVLRKAWLYEQGIQNTATASKRVVNLPNVQRPSASISQDKAKRDALSKTRDAAIDGDMRAKQNFVSNLIS